MIKMIDWFLENEFIFLFMWPKGKFHFTNPFPNKVLMWKVCQNKKKKLNKKKLLNNYICADFPLKKSAFRMGLTIYVSNGLKIWPFNIFYLWKKKPWCNRYFTIWIYFNWNKTKQKSERSAEQRMSVGNILL